MCLLSHLTSLITAFKKQGTSCFALCYLNQKQVSEKLYQMWVWPRIHEFIWFLFCFPQKKTIHSVQVYISTATSVMGITFIFTHCIAVTIIGEYEMQQKDLWWGT